MTIQVSYNGIQLGFYIGDVKILSEGRIYYLKGYPLERQFRNPLLLFIDKWCF